MAPIWLAIRRFRDGRAAVLGLVILVLVTSLFAALTPRVFDSYADDALRGEVQQTWMICVLAAIGLVLFAISLVRLRRVLRTAD